MLRNDRGFTLIEVMATAFVAALVLIGILYSNEMVGRVSEQAHEKTVAVQDAHQVIEQMREIAQFGLFPDNVTNQFPAGQDVAGFNNLNNEQVTVNYQINGEILDVSVTVAWLDAANRAAQYTLSTLMTQRE